MPDSCGCQVPAPSCVCQGMDELCQAVLGHGGCLAGCTQSLWARWLRCCACSTGEMGRNGHGCVLGCLLCAEQGKAISPYRMSKAALQWTDNQLLQDDHQLFSLRIIFC